MPDNVILKVPAEQFAGTHVCTGAVGSLRFSRRIVLHALALRVFLLSLALFPLAPGASLM